MNRMGISLTFNVSFSDGPFTVLMEAYIRLIQELYKVSNITFPINAVFIRIRGVTFLCASEVQCEQFTHQHQLSIYLISEEICDAMFSKISFLFLFMKVGLNMKFIDQLINLRTN